MTGYACLAFSGDDKFRGDGDLLAQPVADNLLGASNASGEFRLVFVNGRERAPECFVAHAGQNTTQLYILQQLNCTGSEARIFVPILPMTEETSPIAAGEHVKSLRVAKGWSATKLADEIRSAARDSGGIEYRLTQQAVSKLENGGLKTVPRWYGLAVRLLSEPKAVDWPPSPDAVQSILSIAASCVSEDPFGEEGLPEFSHAVAAVLRALSSEPSKTNEPNFRGWVGETATAAIVDYRHGNDRAA